MEQVFEILKTKVGSPLSYNNIARDIGISPMTVKRYVEIFEALYLIFIIRPHSTKISRSLSKAPKIYFFDYALVTDPGGRLENFVGLSLLKSLYLKEDSEGVEKKLTYLRTKEGKEVDFAIITWFLTFNRTLTHKFIKNLIRCKPI